MNEWTAVAKDKHQMGCSYPRDGGADLIEGVDFPSRINPEHDILESGKWSMEWAKFGRQGRVWQESRHMSYRHKSCYIGGDAVCCQLKRRLTGWTCMRTSDHYPNFIVRGVTDGWPQ